MITQTDSIVKSKPGPEADLVFKKKVVDLYDSSFMYSYSSVGRIFKITSQRVGQIHKELPHDCPRLINKAQGDLGKEEGSGTRINPLPSEK